MAQLKRNICIVIIIPLILVLLLFLLLLLIISYRCCYCPLMYELVEKAVKLCSSLVCYPTLLMCVCMYMWTSPNSSQGCIKLSRHQTVHTCLFTRIRNSSVTVAAATTAEVTIVILVVALLLLFMLLGVNIQRCRYA